MKRLTLILVVALVGLAVIAMATPAFMTAFTNTYHPKAGTALAKAGCVTCHVKMGSTQLNPYGKSLMKKPQTAASLKAIEKMDSDKDGFTNIAEINAGTLPGDPKSHPMKAAPKPPKKK